MDDTLTRADSPEATIGPKETPSPVLLQTRSVAGFNFCEYNRRFLQNAAGEAVNDAAAYGVRIVPAVVSPGQEYWRVIGVHHLAPAENQGKRNVFLDILDGTGQRAHNPALSLQWGWEGQRPDEPSPPKPFDKPEDEPATNLDLYSGQRVYVAVSGDGCPSDRVENLHSNHPDELGPQGQTWNSIGHHSFYVVFQRTQKATEDGNHDEGDQDEDDQQEPVAPLPLRPMRVRDKLGIDANRPVDPRSGAIAGQVAVPAVIAGTGVGWVRLNFVLGERWSGPYDQNRPMELTWAETYQRIIGGLRGQGLKIYGLISAEAMREDPGDRFRNPGASQQAQEWIERYAATFVQIATLFKDQVEYFESFNEPDDWHGQRCNWVHPDWFARMLQEIHTRVRGEPSLRHIKLISGPLQGLDNNNNAGADYLRQTYRAGKRFFGWGQPGVPFPFDGVGYHLYIAQNPTNVQEEISARYGQYMQAVRRVIREEEGADKPVFLSEFGWQSSVTGDARQAECMRVGTECMLKDPGVALGFWFCTQDFDEKFGLYRQDGLSATNRKPIYDAFKAFCAREIEAPQIEPAPVDNAAYVAGYDAIPDGQVMQPGQRFAQRWVMRNTGSRVWGSGYRLVRVGDMSLESPPNMHVPICAPGREVAVTVPFIAPQEPGCYKSTWQLCNEKGQKFGPRIWLVINVAAPLVEQPTTAAPYPPPVGQEITVYSQATPAEQMVARIWNRYGGLLLAEANRLRIDPSVAVAVLAAEVSGKPYGPDGRLKIRFENHIFYDNWGKQNELRFRQHFSFADDRKWEGHSWRPNANDAWQSFHGNQSTEWRVFEFARNLDEQAALLSISMGAPQIMGFNHSAIGYATVQEMFYAFCSDVGNQIACLFRFIQVKNLVEVVRQRDFLTFAQIYNGRGQAELYKSRIEMYLAIYEQIRSRSI